MKLYEVRKKFDDLVPWGQLLLEVWDYERTQKVYEKIKIAIHRKREWAEKLECFMKNKKLYIERKQD